MDAEESGLYQVCSGCSHCVEYEINREVKKLLCNQL